MNRPLYCVASRAIRELPLRLRNDMVFGSWRFDMKQVIIIGAGGHARVIADIVRRAGDNLLGFLDDNVPALGKVKDYVNYPEAHFIIGIGNAAVRRRIAGELAGVNWYTAIHPTAVIAENVRIGPGSAVMAGAVVNPGAVIGEHCIVNTGSIVEHDNQIENYVHISVGAKLAGTVTIGENTWVGIGAVVSNNLTVCGDCMIGAGAVVVRNITESGTYVGVPARKLSESFRRGDS